MKGNGTLCQKLYTDWGKNIDNGNVVYIEPYEFIYYDYKVEEKMKGEELIKEKQ